MNTVVPLPPNDGSQPGPSFVAPPASQVRAAPFQRASATEQRAVGGDSSRPKGRRNHTITQSVTCVTAGETAADERSVEATVEQRSSAFRFMNEPAAATDTAGDYLRKPAAVVSGQIIREGDAPRETGRFGGVASSPDTDFSTPQASSPRLRETQASNAGDCVPPSSFKDTPKALVNDESYQEAGPQAEASLAGIGSWTPADREGRIEGEAASVDLPTPFLDPAFFAAWRESQGTTTDAEPRVSR